MASSRLARFKAAIKDDLDKIPDKPKPTLPSTPPPEASDEAKDPTNIEQVLDKDDNVVGAITNHGLLTPTTDKLGNLTILDTTHLDSDDDSEAGCRLEIEEASDSEDKKDEDQDDANKPASALGPKMRLGQVTIHGETFCPILPIAKFPYKYVPRAESQAVASAFFDNGQFWAREWDLFYVWPLDTADKPIVFVREEQFAQLLKEVGAKFRKLYIDPKEHYYRHIKLVTEFPDHPRLLPRYLGRSKSRDDYEDFVKQAPCQRPFAFPRNEPEPDKAPSDLEVGEFNDICETAIDLNRAKSKSKNKKQEQKVVIQATLSKQLKRAQRYFGLRKKVVKTNTPEDNFMPPLDITKPPVYDLEEDVIIICVDIEAWERSHSIITEIGVATLDTRDVKDMPPGAQGENWRSKIRARHFRIREHMMYENHEFVQGNADGFEKEFGTTEFINKADACRVVASCFREPFSSPQTQADIDASWEEAFPPIGSTSSTGSTSSSDNKERPKRNIIFLGHNPAADVGYLQKMGFDPDNMLNLREYMDTAGLYRAHKKEQNARGVGGILSEFGLVGWNLHNAGNDAVYTMWIMLATIVAEAQARGKEGDKKEDGEVDEEKKQKSGRGGGDINTDDAAVAAAQRALDAYVVPEEYKTW